MDPDPQPAQTTTPRPPRWGLGDFALGLVSGFTLSGLTGSLWTAVTGSSDGLGSKAASQVGFWTGMVFVALVASRFKGSGRLSEDFGFRARWPDLGIGVVVALVVQLLVLPGVALALRPLLGEPEVSQPVRDLLDEAKGAAYFGLIVSVAVGAPLVEELFFRGLLLRSLQRRLGDRWAVAISSVFFGLAHFSALPWRAVLLVMASLTVFGAVLAVIAIRMGRLGPGIVAHAAFNLFTILVLTFNG